MSVLAKKLKEDEIYKKFKRIVKNSAFLDIPGLMKEVEGLHSSRRTRMLKGASINPKIIIEAAAEDTSYRSRLVEIMIQSSKEYDPLKLAHESISDYLADKYGDILYSGRVSKSDKIGRLNRHILKSANTRLHELKTLSSCCERVIEDIDKTAWTLKTMTETLSLVTKREHIL